MVGHDKGHAKMKDKQRNKELSTRGSANPTLSLTHPTTGRLQHASEAPLTSSNSAKNAATREGLHGTPNARYY